MSCHRGKREVIIGRALRRSMVLQAEDVVKEDFLVLSVRTTVIEGAKAVKGSKHRFAVIGAHHAGHGPGTAER